MSCADTAQLICAFVFTNAKVHITHDAAYTLKTRFVVVNFGQDFVRHNTVFVIISAHAPISAHPGLF